MTPRQFLPAAAAALATLTPALLSADEGVATRADGWYRGDLHFHTNYSDDALEQGGDWMAEAIEIAQYFEDPTLLASFPELEGNGLDYLAITDHRDIQGCSDPEMVSDRLTLICGEEFGSDGHAGAWGLTAKVSHEPQDGRSPNAQIQFAIDQTLGMGGAFSPNHPLYDGDPWIWDVEGYTTIEVWNSYFSLLSEPITPSRVDSAAAGAGIENPYIRPAASLEGVTANQQGIRFWEAHLTVGRNLGVVGGSDRHMLVMPGQPTTYVNADSNAQEDILAGLRAGHTFVSRGPAAPQALLTIIDRLGRTSMMGDTVDLADGPFTLRAEVSRAKGGRLQWVEGVVDPSLDVVGAMVGMDISTVVEDVRINQDVQVLERRWTPGSGAWMYVRVLDPLGLEALDPANRALARGLLKDAEAYGTDYVRLATHLLPLIDVQTLLVPRLCDTAEWDTTRSVCVEIDDVFLGTFHLAEPFHRVVNVWMEDGKATDFAMGALTAAVMAR